MFMRCRRSRKASHYRVLLLSLAVFSIIIYHALVHSSSDHTEETQDVTTNKYYESYLTEYEERIIVGLGDGGKPGKLEGEEGEKGEKAVKHVGMNTVLSDRMSLTRRLKDPRNSLCKKIIYNPTLTASVVVIFNSEHLSVILRTIWSVLLQTPNNLLKEIILVNDASTEANLNGLLKYYLETRLKNYNITLIRLKYRGGLIKARLSGAKAATGDVLVFLDAHCEVTVGWMEPLLHRIEQDNTAVVVPIIDRIQADTLEYSPIYEIPVVSFDRSLSVTHFSGDPFPVGGFTWDGYFGWIDIQNEEDKNQVTPVKTPTMAGGLFAIHRKFFWDIGSYDEQMEGWGGENLEISFRIWQCGGRLETVPCSRVGHVFRDTFPYPMPNTNRINTHAINTARLAEVWMDEYKRLFYMHKPQLKNKPFILGDLTKRKQLRKRLHCKSFRWYLQNVYPQKFIPDENAYVYGQFRTEGMNCLDTLQLSEDKEGPLGTYFCHKDLRMSQFFTVTLTGQLRTEDFCADVVDKRNVNLVRCVADNPAQKWKVFQNGTIYHPKSRKCLTAPGIDYGKGAIVVRCDKSAFQKWQFSNVNHTALNDISSDLTYENIS